MNKQYIVVGLGQERYGIDIKQVLNIIKMLDITRVPLAPTSVKGVVNLRGEILPVMSARKEFGLADDVFTKDTRIIFTKVDDAPIGLIVDRVHEVIDMGEGEIEKLDEDSMEGKKPYIWGVGKVGRDFITLLDVEELVHTAIGVSTAERKVLNG